jgi:predicted secreted protein
MTTKQAKLVKTVSVTTYQKRKKPRKHYVFQIQVSWNDTSEFYIFRRYSEFYSFHVSSAWHVM